MEFTIPMHVFQHTIMGYLDGGSQYRVKDILYNHKLSLTTTRELMTSIIERDGSKMYSYIMKTDEQASKFMLWKNLEHFKNCGGCSHNFCDNNEICSSCDICTKKRENENYSCDFYEEDEEDEYSCKKCLEIFKSMILFKSDLNLYCRNNFLGYSLYVEEYDSCTDSDIPKDLRPTLIARLS